MVSPGRVDISSITIHSNNYDISSIILDLGVTGLWVGVVVGLPILTQWCMVWLWVSVFWVYMVVGRCGWVWLWVGAGVSGCR